MEFYECCVVRVNIGGLYYNYNNLIKIVIIVNRIRFMVKVRINIGIL